MTLRKALYGYVVGVRGCVAWGMRSTDRSSGGKRPSSRRLGQLALILVLGMVLAGCVMPAAIPAQEESAEESATVGAIQTRVAETRAELQGSDESMAAEDGSSEATEGQTAAVEESEQMVSPTAEQLELLAKLRPQGEAPELLNEVWLNSEPLKLADLRGKVVLVEFWTYG